MFCTSCKRSPFLSFSLVSSRSVSACRSIRQWTMESSLAVPCLHTMDLAGGSPSGHLLLPPPPAAAASVALSSGWLWMLSSLSLPLGFQKPRPEPKHHEMTSNLLLITSQLPRLATDLTNHECSLVNRTSGSSSNKAAAKNQHLSNVIPSSRAPPHSRVSWFFLGLTVPPRPAPLMRVQPRCNLQPAGPNHNRRIPSPASASSALSPFQVSACISLSLGTAQSM